MLQTSSYRACPLCDGRDCTPATAYSPAPWEDVTCDGCRITYLRTPVEYEALDEDSAWEKTDAAKSDSTGGSTRTSKTIRKIRTKRSRSGYCVRGAGANQSPCTGYIETSGDLPTTISVAAMGNDPLCIEDGTVSFFISSGP